MRLIYALILCAGFELHWGWYVASVAVWFVTVVLREGDFLPEVLWREKRKTHG